MPAAGYEISYLLGQRASTAATRCARSLAVAARGARRRRGRARLLRRVRRRRRARRRRLRRRPGRTRGRRCAHAARAERGRQPPRARQPAARAVCAARLPRVPDRRAGRASATWSRAGRSRATIRRRATATQARARLGIDADGAAACSCSVAASAPASINLAAIEAFARARESFVRGSRRPVGATSLSCRGALERPAGLRTTASRVPRQRSPTRLRPATWCWRERAARSSRSPRPAGRRCWSRIRTPRPTTRRDNARWMADAGAAVVIDRRRLDRARFRAWCRSCSRDSERLASDGIGRGSACSPGCRGADRRRVAEGRRESQPRAAGLRRLERPAAALRRHRRRGNERAAL